MFSGPRASQSGLSSSASLFVLAGRPPITGLVQAGKILHGFHPMPIIEFVTMFEHGENRHHTLQGPDTDVLPLRNIQFGILYKEMIANVHWKVTVTVDPLYADFYFGHGPSPT